jgi:hypothetical protein
MYNPKRQAMKQTVFFIIMMVMAGVTFLSCEKLAEEETPVCKDCYKVKMLISNNQVLDTVNFYRLCGGDVIAWNNFTDSIQDTIKIHCYCNN